MRLLFIGTIPIDGKGISPDTMEAHIVSALGKLSVDCEYFPILTRPLGGRLNRWLQIAQTDYGLLRTTPAQSLLVKAIKSFHPDMILVLLGNYTTPATFQMIREVTRAPIVCWCQDHMGTMGRQYIIGSRFDYLFTKDQAMVDLFRHFTGLPEVHYLAEACNPDVHRPVDLTSAEREQYECDITTAATLYYFRAEILAAVSDFDLRIWGATLPYYDGELRRFHMGRPLFMHDKAACFNGARIVINTLHPMEAGGLNARAFEVAGCGGFQLMSHTDVVIRHFEPDKEIVTFRDLDELRNKVRYFLDHEEERHEIASAGQRRAHEEHTYVRRLQQMFDIMNASDSATTSSPG